jgi:hypothetical protein
MLSVVLCNWGFWSKKRPIKLHTWERHKLYYTLGITVNISTKMRWAEHAANARKLEIRTQIMYQKLQVRDQAERKGNIEVNLL